MSPPCASPRAVEPAPPAQRAWRALLPLLTVLLLVRAAAAQTAPTEAPAAQAAQAAPQSAEPEAPSPPPPAGGVAATTAAPGQAAAAPGRPAEAPGSAQDSRPALPAQLPLKDLTEQGIRQFQRGEFDAAVESFSAAHVLSPNPMFLFNIAQAHRKAGRPREALTHYQLFLRKAPDSPLRPETEAYIALVEAQLQAQQQAKQQAAQPVQGPSTHEREANATAKPEATESPARPLYKRGWFYGLLAGATVAVGLGVGLGVYFGTRPPATTLGIIDPVF